MAESVGFLESVACALGPMPGLDLYQAADVIVGETGDCMALPELVQRGVTDQLVGRTCALLPELPVEKVRGRGGLVFVLKLLLVDCGMGLNAILMILSSNGGMLH